MEKRQSLFSGENKKTISNLSSAESVQIVIKVKVWHCLQIVSIGDEDIFHEMSNPVFWE